MPPKEDKLIRWLATLVVMLCLASAVAEGAMEILSPDEIRPGMRGYGITVFQGTKPTTFEVELLGVMKNAEPRGDIILARLRGGPLAKTGLIMGMSGSPIYVKGKLVGAVAYGWAHAKEAICGITPIGQMLENLKDQSLSLRGSTWPSCGSPEGLPMNKWWERLGPKETSVTDVLHPWLGFGQMRLEGGQNESAPAALRPIAAPVMISCVDSSLLNALRPYFERFNMAPVQSGESAIEPSGPEDLQPGSAVGILMIGGDMTGTAIGTVTHRAGPQVLAFGHSFMAAGAVSLPMSLVHVHAILPSQFFSFKLASGGDVVGRFEQDRRFAVAGEIGRFAPMVPCYVSVTREPHNRTHRYFYRVAKERNWTGLLAAMTIASSLLRTETMRGDLTAEMEMRVAIAERAEPVRIRNMLVNDGQLPGRILELGQYVRLLQDNPFTAANVREIRANLRVREERRLAHIEAIRVDKMLAKPGHEVTVTAILHPFQGKDSFSHEFRFTVPRHLEPGTSLQVAVCDAGSSLFLERSRAPGKFAPRTLDQLIELIERQEPNNNLILRVGVPEMGLTSRGAALPDLPSSLFAMMSRSTQSGAGPMMSEIVQRVSTDWVIVGGQMLTIAVEKEE